MQKSLNKLFQLVFMCSFLAVSACAVEPTQTTSKTKAAPAATLKPAAGNPVVALETTVGTITLELFADQAPITVENFLAYVDEGFYNGLIFHRVIPYFMIQGGGHNKNLVKMPPREPIKNESSNGLSNVRGTIAMARTGHPDSATSQFFINLVMNPSLDARGNRSGYTVFGRVINGMDIVDAIGNTETQNTKFYNDVPVEPIIIKSAKKQ